MNYLLYQDLEYTLLRKILSNSLDKVNIKDSINTYRRILYNLFSKHVQDQANQLAKQKRFHYWTLIGQLFDVLTCHQLPSTTPKIPCCSLDRDTSLHYYAILLWGNGVQVTPSTTHRWVICLISDSTVVPWVLPAPCGPATRHTQVEVKRSTSHISANSGRYSQKLIN